MPRGTRTTTRDRSACRSSRVTSRANGEDDADAGEDDDRDRQEHQEPADEIRHHEKHPEHEGDDPDPQRGERYPRTSPMRRRTRRPTRVALSRRYPGGPDGGRSNLDRIVFRYGLNGVDRELTVRLASVPTGTEVDHILRPAAHATIG